jgi:hypothetical protein
LPSIASFSQLPPIEYKRFNKVPDFFSVDEFGRQADSFQYFIDVDGKLPVFGGSPYYSGVETIIRGEEIHIQGDIVLSDVEPPNTDDENSGGWGAVRGSVPYHLHHKILTFKVPLDLMGDSDGEFSYRLEWYEFGSTNGFLENKSVKGKHKKERRACFPVTETQN